MKILGNNVMDVWKVILVFQNASTYVVVTLLGLKILVVMEYLDNAIVSLDILAEIVAKNVILVFMAMIVREVILFYSGMFYVLN